MKTTSEDDSGEYCCDKCEKRRDERMGAYVCLQCPARWWAYHIECVFPEINFPISQLFEYSESAVGVYGDQWWYASPTDWATTNGHYELVSQLLNIDNNHLFKLTSLLHIHRLEIVWDDEANFHDVVSYHSQVARKLFIECESKNGKNSLIRAGYGGWLLYASASAGDLGFVRELLERDPLLVFGEGEYGVTDVLYAADRSKSHEVFRMIVNLSASPRLSKKHMGEIPAAYRREVMNRAAHVAARGGDLEMLREILSDGCSSNDALAYQEVVGSSILHAAVSKGQVEVIKRRPSSASSDILIRRLVSAGAVLGARDFTTRKAITSQLKMQGNASSPGTSIKIADCEIFLAYQDRECDRS